MYEYRKLTPKEREELIRERLARGAPPHQPPHPVRMEGLYILTAACYEHHPHMHSSERRQMLLDLLFEQCIQRGIALHAWVVLPNHYHVREHVPAFEALGEVFRRVHGRTAHDWNVEDDAQGRKMWYRYSDRAMRSERHYYTTLNYIHVNPMKHGVSESPYEWPWSSVGWYVEHHGREWLRDVWRTYPVRAYGAGWDEH
jgi:putative transposase